MEHYTLLLRLLLTTPYSETDIPWRKTMYNVQCRKMYNVQHTMYNIHCKKTM